MEDIFTIANKNFNSRLIVGTGKYKNFEETTNAIKASGADMVTVAVRRVNILDKDQPLLMDYLDPKSITYLPNTAGCYSSEEALTASAVSSKLLYFPVPTINRELKFLFAIVKISSIKLILPQ